jgi:hypothetical protein
MQAEDGSIELIYMSLLFPTSWRYRVILQENNVMSYIYDVKTRQYMQATEQVNLWLI